MPVVLNYVSFDEDHIHVGDEIIEIYRDTVDFYNLRSFMERHAFPEKKWMKIRRNETLFNRVFFKNVTINNLPELCQKHNSRRIVLHLSEDGSISKSIVKLFESLR